MSTARKAWLGILTFLPFILTLVYIIYFFSFFLETIIDAEKSGGEFPVELFEHLTLINVSST